MSLDVSKLEKVRELAGGGIQARCPACAEGGHDRSGEHLRIYPDGRFGCCVHPKDGEHRKRIFALVGVRKPGTFTLRVKTPPAMTAARSVKAALVNSLQPSPGLRPPSPAPASEGIGTLGTHETESENGVPNVPSSPIDDFGTLGTGDFNPRAYARGELPTVVHIGGDSVEKLKDSESAVPSVPSLGVAEPPIVAGERLPFLTPGGDLSIPFDSPERYHWWRGGQSVAATLAELRAGVATKRG